MKPFYFTIILAFCCLLPVKAQNTSRNDSLLNREMMLEREYTPTLRDAVKLGQFPELREPQAPKSAVEFSNYAIPYEVQSKLFPLRPQAYLTNLNYSKHKGFLTGGISSQVDINGDFGYQFLNTDKDRLNIFFSHRSSGSDVSYLQELSEYQLENETKRFKINDNWGGLNYLHDFGEIRFYADAKYTYSAFNYYGLSIPRTIHGLPPTLYYNDFDKNINQVNQMFETNIGISSEKSDGLNYKANLGYTNFRQKYGNRTDETGGRESRVLIDGDVHQLINSNTGLGLSASIKTYSYNEPFHLLNDSMTNYWTYSLNPYIYWENSNLNLLLGVRLTGEVSGRKKTIASPVVRLNYFPSNRFMFYILADGGRSDNSQYNLFYENRYIDPLTRVMDSRSPIDATAGVKFTPLPTLSVGIFGGYKVTRDEHFFYPIPGGIGYYSDDTPMLAGNRIIPVYEDANTIKLGADLKYAFQNTFELSLKGTYYQWSIQESISNNEAWNKPDFEINANAAYRFPWIPLRFDLSYLGAYGRKAGAYLSSEIIKMNDIHDLSLKGAYSFTPNFSAYVSLNNLLFSKYDFWWGYPAQGFSVMGGLSVLF